MGFGQPLAASTRFEQLGFSGATGTLITSGNATKGSYATVGTTGFAYDYFYLDYVVASTARYRIDVAVTIGGTDVVVAADLFVDRGENAAQIMIPVSVPAGVAIKVRAQSSAGNTFRASVTGIAGDSNLQTGFSRVVSATTFSGSTPFLDPANTVTLNGTTPTGWAQIIASTPFDFAGLYAQMDGLGNGALTNNIFVKFDVGIGPAASEIPLFSIASKTTGAICIPRVFQPCNIPAGSRLAVRGVASQADTDTMSVVLCGLVP